MSKLDPTLPSPRKLKLDMDQVRFAAKWMQIIPSMIYCTCNFCSFLTTKFSKGGGDSHLKRRRYWSWILKRTSERHWGFLLALLEICFNPKEVQYPKRYRKSSLCGPFDAKHPMRYQNLYQKPKPPWILLKVILCSEVILLNNRLQLNSVYSYFYFCFLLLKRTTHLTKP